MKHLIDCDTYPKDNCAIEAETEIVVEAAVYNRSCGKKVKTPEWKVIEHQKGGMFEWDPDRIFLYLAPWQSNPGVSGNELRNNWKEERFLMLAYLNTCSITKKLSQKIGLVWTKSISGGQFTVTLREA